MADLKQCDYKPCGRQEPLGDAERTWWTALAPAGTSIFATKADAPRKHLWFCTVECLAAHADAAVQDRIRSAFRQEARDRLRAAVTLGGGVAVGEAREAFIEAMTAGDWMSRPDAVAEVDSFIDRVRQEIAPLVPSK